MTGIRRSVQTIFITVLTAAVLTACGSAAKSYNTSTASYGGAVDTAAYDDGFYEETAAVADEYELAEEGAMGVEENLSIPEDALAGRKLIKNVNMDVETEQFDVLLPALNNKVAALGGYIEEMSSYSRNDNYDADYRGTKYLRYANMTIRIPKERLDTFLEEVGEQSNVVSRSESVTDVTLQYVDLESHKKALITEQDRLLELLGQAENVEDIIAIEGRLSEVRYQIESMESQLRTFDNQIDYSTVYLYINEVERYTPTEETGTGERIRRGFMNSLWNIQQGAGDFAVWFLISIPYLVLWAVAIILGLLILRTLFKALWKRRIKKTGRHEGSNHLFRNLPRMRNAKQVGKDHAAQNEKAVEESEGKGNETSGRLKPTEDEENER